MSYKVLSDNKVVLTSSPDEWKRLSENNDIPYQEIGLIDFNRTGVKLDQHEVRISYRARFNASILYPDDWSWFALPVRDEGDSHFHINGHNVFFDEEIIGRVDQPILDTCDTSYQRGPHLLNLNSRSRSNCAGCKACVHNDKKLYDNTVIHDRDELQTYDDIQRFFNTKISDGINIGKLKQIAIVTGLFASEAATLQHIQDVHHVASQLGFRGELLYFGCQIISPYAIEQLAELGNVCIVFAIDNFTNRKRNLSAIKSSLSLDELKSTMELSRMLGISTTFAYIAGVDSLKDIEENFLRFANVCTRFPIVNIFQIQTSLQAQALHADARNLEYYIKARKIIENVFKDTALRPQRWENYRPLWYRDFNHEQLDVKPYG